MNRILILTLLRTPICIQQNVRRLVNDSVERGLPVTDPKCYEDKPDSECVPLGYIRRNGVEV